MFRWLRSASMSATRWPVVLSARVAVRRRTPAAALVEDDDAVIPRIEEAAMRRGGAGARTAVQEQHRRAARIAGLLPVHHVRTAKWQTAGGVRLDLRERGQCDSDEHPYGRDASGRTSSKSDNMGE